jgi:hypothetical protein
MIGAGLLMGAGAVSSHAEAGSPFGRDRPSSPLPPGSQVVELHYSPVENAQIAVWLEDSAGNFVRDIFVTQSIGKLGLGNRGGLWDFVSSWRAPYGPRPSSLPVWAHARGKTYPKIVFHDPDAGDQFSLGWHESTSSDEPYYCIPLAPDENELVLDSMTCPSPNNFRTDKGEFHGSDTSVYPPRSDLLNWDSVKDSVDVQQFAALNDLDAVTGATPPGGDTFHVVRITEEEAQMGGLVARVEINVENDQNPDWMWDRLDHYVDPRLPSIGVAYLGQPSIVYSVPFDPSHPGLWTTPEYEGYGSWDGTDGDLRPPDSTISSDGGSGADRLRRVERFGHDFRLAVYLDVDLGEGGGNPCPEVELPPVEDLKVAPVSFDAVEVRFTVPELPAGLELSKFSVRHQQALDAVDWDDERAYDASTHAPVVCSVEGQTDCDAFAPGDELAIEVPELFGNRTYTFAVSYGDRCANVSGDALATVRTPEQEFTQLSGFCFVATAAYGAQWEPQVAALRRFRDEWMMPNPLGHIGVALYYKVGPYLAIPLKRSPELRAGVRRVLQPVADWAAAMTE